MTSELDYESPGNTKGFRPNGTGLEVTRLLKKTCPDHDSMIIFQKPNDTLRLPESDIIILRYCMQN